MRDFIGFLCGLAFLGLCGIALLANENAALSGKYAKADQFLSSLYK